MKLPDVPGGDKFYDAIGASAQASTSIAPTAGDAVPSQSTTLARALGHDLATSYDTRVMILEATQKLEKAKEEADAAQAHAEEIGDKDSHASAMAATRFPEVDESWLKQKIENEVHREAERATLEAGAAGGASDGFAAPGGGASGPVALTRST